MDLHSIIIELYFPPCQVFSCFSPFCLFLPHAFVPGAQKKQDLPRRQTLFFRKFPSQLRYSRSRSRTIRT